ncbi:MAG: hypothetical protein ACOC0A_04300 [Planctomycetota bacterium]
MRKVILSFVAVLVIGMLVGCGAPGWVEQDPDVRKGKASMGVYGVGEGMSELSTDAQVNFASIKARSAIDKAEKEYVSNLLKMFVESNDNWFNVDEVEKLGLYEKAAEATAESTMLNTEELDQWTDNKGTAGDEGTLYLLRYLPLDGDFFDVMLENYKAVIDDNAEEVLDADKDDVMSALEKCVMKLEENPLMMDVMQNTEGQDKEEAESGEDEADDSEESSDDSSEGQDKEEAESEEDDADDSEESSDDSSE